MLPVKSWHVKLGSVKSNIGSRNLVVQRVVDVAIRRLDSCIFSFASLRGSVILTAVNNLGIHPLYARKQHTLTLLSRWISAAAVQSMGVALSTNEISNELAQPNQLLVQACRLSTFTAAGRVVAMGVALQAGGA